MRAACRQRSVTWARCAACARSLSICFCGAGSPYCSSAGRLHRTSLIHAGHGSTYSPDCTEQGNPGHSVHCSKAPCRPGRCMALRGAPAPGASAAGASVPAAGLASAAEGCGVGGWYAREGVAGGDAPLLGVATASSDCPMPWSMRALSHTSFSPSHCEQQVTLRDHRRSKDSLQPHEHKQCRCGRQHVSSEMDAGPIGPVCLMQASAPAAVQVSCGLTARQQHGLRAAG